MVQRVTLYLVFAITPFIEMIAVFKRAGLHAHSVTCHNYPHPDPTRMFWFIHVRQCHEEVI